MLPARLFLFGIILCAAASADIMSRCVCDPARPETLKARECSLTLEALKRPPEPPTFFLKDINPRKANRMLALPRALVFDLNQLPPAQRAAYWSATVAKARELWGDGWGLSLNGTETRTQCQLHIHIGKLIPELETDNFVIVDSPAAIPVPTDGSGLWVIPSGGKYKVFLGETITESVILR